MKLSKRGEYALRALIKLGMAHEAGRPMLRIQEIVDNEVIPTAFLEQIFAQLREAGFIDGKRGKHGGYFLAQPADTISMGQIVRLVDGPLAPISCVSQTNYKRCSCPDEEHCGLRMLMLDVRNSISRILDEYSLEQVIKLTLNKLHSDGLPSPFSNPIRTIPSRIAQDYEI